MADIMEISGAVESAIQPENAAASFMPKVVEDLSCWPYMSKGGKQIYSLGSKDIDRYLMVDEEKKEIIMECVKYMDGSHTLEWIQNHVMESRKVNMEMTTLYKKLAASGLIEGEKATDVSSEISFMGVDLLKLNFGRVGDRARRNLSVVWSFFYLASFAIFAAAILGVILKWDKAEGFISHAFLYRNSYVLGALVAACFSILNVGLHEIGHWLTAIRNGLQPSEFHMTLYAGVMPMWYVKIKGMYTVDTKKRVAIMGAGMYTNAMLMMIALAVAMWGNLTVMQSQLMSKLMIANLFQIITCLSPLQLSDGYFIMSQALKLSNLRMRMMKAMGGIFNGKRERVDTTLVVYFLISIGFILASTYWTILWNFKVFYELAAGIDILLWKYVVICLPFIVTGTTIFLFLRSFAGFVKSLDGGDSGKGKKDNSAKAIG